MVPASKVLLAYFSRAGENYYYGDRTTLEIGNTQVVAGLISSAITVDSCAPSSTAHCPPGPRTDGRSTLEHGPVRDHARCPFGRHGNGSPDHHIPPERPVALDGQLLAARSATAHRTGNTGLEVVDQLVRLVQVDQRRGGPALGTSRTCAPSASW